MLAGAKPHDLRFGRVQPQSAGSHPLIDVMDLDSEAVDGDPYIADWHADVNLAVVDILVDVQTVTQDQLFKLSSVQKDWSEVDAVEYIMVDTVERCRQVKKAKQSDLVSVGGF